MKKILLSLFTIVLSVFAFAQTPQSFSYQAVARNTSGQTINNQAVKFRMSILKGSINGTFSYSEIHSATTNNYGLVTLGIGSGTLVSGSFTGINWANGPYFIKIEMDATGGNSYQLMGTSQLLSVPYAKYAELSGNNVLPQYSQAQIDMLNPVAGMLIYNTDYHVLQFYDGAQWNGSQSSGCIPQPNIANAGADKLNLLSTSTMLSGNLPAIGITGKWEIVSGTGGSFSDATKYNALFTGLLNKKYILSWKLMSKCDSTSDEMIIQTYTCPDLADAGVDQLGLSTITTTLSGNAPSAGINGKWEVVSGSGGSFSDATKYNTTFTGVNNSAYKLRWSLFSVCDTTSAEVIISLGTPSINYDGETFYVYPFDNEIQTWNNGVSITINAMSLTDGKTNTNSIVLKQGVGSYAAYLCDTLNAYGYSDWYLPSKEELNVLYINKDSIGGFNAFSSYWSSTESVTEDAWYQNFNSGIQSPDYKWRVNRVRCVRK